MPGNFIEERRQWFIAHSDHLRTFLMNEPRGHGTLSGAILQPPTVPDAHWGVLFIEVTGVLPMCGAGTIAVATVLVDTGMVAVTEPVTVCGWTRRSASSRLMSLCETAKRSRSGSSTFRRSRSRSISASTYRVSATCRTTSHTAAGWLDRSPGGTGTSARMAVLHARGELALDTDFVNESFIGTTFTGRLIERTTVAGIDAVVPSITGRAWITSTSQFLLDPDDPFPDGYTI